MDASRLVMFVLAFCTTLQCQTQEAEEVKPAWEPSERQVLLHSECQRHRLANGRNAQELDEECCGIAQRWAEHMAARRSMYHGGGEQIIAYGYSTPAITMQVWINSGGHNAWLLSRTSRAGWGAAQSSNGTWYWAGAFRGSTATSTGSTSEGSNDRGGGLFGWGLLGGGLFRRR